MFRSIKVKLSTKRLGLYQATDLNKDGFNVYFKGGLRSDKHFNAQEYWLSISREENLEGDAQDDHLWWMKRKGAGTQKESQICCGLFITKLARKTRVLTDDVIRSLSTPIYYRDLDMTTLRELIDSEGRLIPEDPQPGVPRVGIPRSPRASMQDLYDRMGRIELASPKQTALGKDFSNPLMADSLPKTIWLSIHLVVYNEELAIPGQTATGKESSNPFMAGSLPKTIHFCDSLPSDEDSFELIELMILCTNFLTMLSWIYPIQLNLISAKELKIYSEGINIISQEDANLKLLRSLPSAWNNIALIMRNKSDLDTLSMDDLYNNLKVYESEIKVQSRSSSNSQNVAFVSLENTSSTNEAVNTAHEVSTASS
ncbi:hypothetical protein Tco_1515252 [Tanacetum coccineum]